MHSLNDAGEMKKGTLRDAIYRQHQELDNGILGRKRKSDRRYIEQHGVKEVVQLERLTSELTTPTRVSLSKYEK